ncbi:MAG: DUF1194 domain-containing protein [Anderseniella sp.]
MHDKPVRHPIDRRRMLILSGAGVAAIAAGPTIAQVGGEVDLILVLAVDCSYSVDAREFRLQMDGIGHAFKTKEVQRAIESGPHGKIAVTIFQWSDAENQSLSTPWTIINGADSANAFAQKVYSIERELNEGGTAIGAALLFGAAAITAAPFTALRKVIDVSSDGRNNRGDIVEVARDEVISRGITINGLAILNEWPTLDKYFEKSVVGGPYHFVLPANDYEAYREAIYRKLLKEITGPGLS